ncbi:hypothetical protein [Tolypothrix sp. VBCCA 56010]|uniref:hypothetical protein n=1 Tax=Tolypothrix sp. VBCCA 56010 TaxID=3137731 RepID=UPI003D7DD6BD
MTKHLTEKKAATKSTAKSSHNKGFTPTRAFNPCQICSDTSGKCRETESVLLCMNITDAHSATNSFKFIGLTKDGLWGKFVKDDGQNFTQQQREQWQQEQKLQKLSRLKAEQQRRSGSLSESDRNKEISLVLSQLSLLPEHKTDLQHRGLTDEQIAALKFCSVEQWQKLESEVSYKLAGISIHGKSLITQAGYICPIRNPQGLITGWQLRADNASDGGKYKWASSRTRKRTYGASSHLPNGELPINYCRPLNQLQSQYIGLTEGILKPQITAIKRNQIVLGAAAGNFAGSPATFKSYLEHASYELGNTKDVILYVDAGAIANPNVMNQYRRTYKLVTKIGYNCVVAWWGQYSKTDCDIDELSADVEVALITFSQFEEIARSSNRDERLTQWIKDLFGKLAKKADKQMRRFSHRKKEVLVEADEIKARIVASSLPQAIDYIPGSLPTPEQYKQLNCPKIRYKREERLQFWEETQTAGWQHVLDNSAPGLGKSHEAGCAKPDNFGIEKLFYLSADHRNPTTMTVEQNYTDLTVRHNGLKLDFSRKTPLGQDFQVWANSNEKPDTQGNCFRADLFAALRSKNIPNIEGRESPICATCHLASACQSTSGPGFGFRSLRRDALSQLCVRAHPDSLPKTDEFDYNTVGAFWDETSTLLKATKNLTFELKDFEHQMGELENKLPSVHAALRPLRVILRNLLKEEILPTSRHGFDDADIRALLPNKPENLADMINQIETALVPDLNFLESADGIDVKSVEKEYRAAAYTASLIMRQQNYRIADKGINSVALNWLVPFLKVWNRERGSLRCEYGKLTVHTRNDRHSELANAFKFNIYLDATLTTKLLAVKLGVNQQDILVAEETPPSYSNLQIIQVAGLGKLGKVRSESLTKRVNALKAELTSRHQDESESKIAFIDWKAQATNDEGYHFRDGRGINRFQDKSALVSIGVPYPNIGRLQAEFQTLTGCYVSLENSNFTEESCSDLEFAPNPDIQSAIQKQFQLFVSEHVQSEIIQEVGRLRSHKRPTEQLTYYFVGDYDLSFLFDTYSDANFQCLQAFSITPEAGTAYEQNKWVMLQAARQIIESGKKLTQVAIAKTANMTQGRISQIAKEFGGWTKFQKVLSALLEGLSNGDNATHVQDVETSWLAKTYLPLLAENPDNHSSVEIVKEIGALLLVYRHKMFCAILSEMSIQTKATILGHLFRLFSPELREEFTEMLLN